MDFGFINDDIDDLLKHALNESMIKSEGSSGKELRMLGLDWTLAPLVVGV